MDNAALLIQRSLETRKRIAVIGDAMIDVWVHGRLEGCQDHCPKFVEQWRETTPGGAANAARQLANWNVDVTLISPLDNRNHGYDGHGLESELIPCKVRFMDNGKCVFRNDVCDTFSPRHNPEWTERVLELIRRWRFDAVLLSDYDKGFLSDGSIRSVLNLCRELRIPIIVDAKRAVEVYDGISHNGGFVKCNADYFKWLNGYGLAGYIVTGGEHPPKVNGHNLCELRPYVECKNHVGAGDCFAAHLALATAHGFDYQEAADLAYSAGRVYVQHEHGRPPWPHEIRKDMLPKAGKILAFQSPSVLRQPGKKIVFTNGVFRLPHAGHCWLLEWAKAQGDILVVGVNDDESARMAKGPENFVLPLEERCEWLCGLECVDWVVPYSSPEPLALISLLEPDILVKGHEYAGRRVPGDDMVKDVRFGPENKYPRHCTDLVEEVRKSR